MSPDKYKALFELHIEQGPILEDAGKDIGVVTCVLGQMIYRVKFHGFAAHCGTFPMKKRHDAFHAAAKLFAGFTKKSINWDMKIWYIQLGEVVIHPCVNTVIPVISISPLM